HTERPLSRTIPGQGAGATLSPAANPGRLSRPGMARSAAAALALAFALGSHAGADVPASAATRVEAPPRALACLAKWYPVGPLQVNGAWHVRLAGQTYPWDDGKSKSFEEKLAAPDLEDTFSLPYVAGPIAAVTRENHDPGRIRFDPLFRATYGASETQVAV